MKTRAAHWVIVGGGTAGWIAASALAHQFPRDQVKITLIESSTIPTVGVGEAVIPPFLTFIRNLGINEQEFVANVAGSFKLGIEFRDWYAKGSRYFHHFGSLGRAFNGNDFYSCWRKIAAQGDAGELMDYAPAAVMAQHNKFFLPFKLSPQSGFDTASYALHFDAALVAQTLSRFAQAKGVERIDAKVEQVAQAPNGDIDSLTLDTGGTIKGDFYIDCSGFRGLLIDQTLKAPYLDWRQWLPCDSAVAVQSAHTGQTPPYTTASAQAAGWIWRIPLQHRFGNGYVYCSDDISDDEAEQTLRQQLQGDLLHAPRTLRFTTGVRPESWTRNCIALGLAGGFLEPLESTAIHLVTRGVQFLLSLFPTPTMQAEQYAPLAREFNRRMLADYEEIRDFLILHYCTTTREDTAFWRRCKTLPLPDTLQHRLALFSARGQLPPENDELFKKGSWQAVLHGMGVRPAHLHPAVDQIPVAELSAALKAGRDHLQQGVQQLPDHDQFLREFCPAPR